MQSQTSHHGSSASIVFSSAGRDISPYEQAIQCFSWSESIPVSQILHASRGSRPVAEARKLAMYLIHVCCGLNLTETGVIFGRDRTTVRHACACIEDQRENFIFEKKVSLLEEQIKRLDKTTEPQQ